MRRKSNEANPQLNQYGMYRAEYCRSTGLPMYQKSTYGPVADTLLSRTRCQKIGQPVQMDEQPAAFYRMQTGYCGLYKRERSKT